MTHEEVISGSPEETLSLGFKFAAHINPQEIVGLFGNLGTGKTQFVRGICKYFGADENVSSPTFIIVNQYNGKDKRSDKPIDINHFDLYRLENLSELKEIGIESYVKSDSICLIEWAELADEYFKNDLRKIYFKYGEKENERKIKII